MKPEALTLQDKKPSSRRYLALWFPFLSTDRLALTPAPAEPLVLVEKQQGALRVVAGDAKAQALNLHAGLALTDARSRVPHLRIETIDRVKDAELLQQLVGLCEFFTPLFAGDGADGLLMDITGCAHLFKGEQGLYQAVSNKFIRTKITFRMAIASTPEAARAVAHHMDVAIVSPERMEQITRLLPIHALCVPDDTLLALKRAGLRSLGDLLDRPSQGFTARFGAKLITQLNRICGREDIRLTPLRAPPDYMAERQFISPLVDMENIITSFNKLAEIIESQLQERGEGGRIFEAIFFRSDGAIRRLHIETAEAVRDPETLIRLMRLRLDGLSDPLDPGFGFDALRLSVLRSDVFAQGQTALDGQIENEQNISNLLDQYSVSLGRTRVSQFLLHDTHDTLREASRISVLDQAPPNATTTAPALPRPLTLFDRPHLIETLAEVPDGPPLRFRWRHVLHDVALAEGPERISPEWWRQDSAMHTRDYYRVEDTQGYRFWVFREGLYGQGVKTPRWYVHGLFP